MSDSLFTDVAEWAKKSPLIILVCIAGLWLMLSGGEFFVEDANSNYQWVIQIQQDLNIRLASWGITLRFMAIFPQVATTVFLYTWAVDRKKNAWALVAAIAMALVDYIPDVWWRANGQMDLSTSLGRQAALATNLASLGYYTIGSEIALSFGFGTFFSTVAPAVAKSKELWKALKDATMGNEFGNNRNSQRNKQKRQEPRVTYQRSSSQPQRDPSYRREGNNGSNGARTNQHLESVQPNRQVSREGQGHNQAARRGQHPYPFSDE